MKAKVLFLPPSPPGDSMAAKSMAAREKILLIRLKSIGDILFTLPAVHAVRENFPESELHFLVSQEHAPLLRGFTEVDRVIPLDRAVYRSGNLLAAAASTFELFRRLRRENYSLTIDFQSFGETEMLAWWSGAPERWGHYARLERGWACTRAVAAREKLAPAEWHLNLLRECGLRTGEVRNEFVLPADAEAEARHFFVANNLDPLRPTLFLQPFTSSPHKNWPLENFLQLAQHWRAAGAQIIFGGGPGERAKLESIRAAGFAVSAGLPLLVAAGLMKLSTLIVGGDTGLLHLAVAMGRRVVMLMPDNAGLTHPFQHPDWTIFSPPGKNVADIPPEKLIAETERAFAALKSNGLFPQTASLI